MAQVGEGEIRRKWMWVLRSAECIEIIVKKVRKLFAKRETLRIELSMKAYSCRVAARLDSWR